jgi:hypothetical protein
MRKLSDEIYKLSKDGSFNEKNISSQVDIFLILNGYYD